MTDIPRIHLLVMRDRHPFLFDRAQYVDVGLGWLPTIETYLAAVSGSAIEILELKEKFGGLRIWVNITEAYIDEDMRYLELAKILTQERTRWRCEICGQPGHVRTPPEGRFAWLQCRCNAHCTPDQLSWPPPTRERPVPYGGLFYRYDRETDSLVETEAPPRFTKDTE